MRTYKLFGSDSDHPGNWVWLGDVLVGGAQQALNKARESGRYTTYAVVPERNWSEGTPEVVERAPVVKWTKPPKAQMTVDDVIEEAEAEGVKLPASEQETRKIG